MELWFDDTDRGKTELNLTGHGEVQLLRHCATIRKVASSIPNSVIEIFPATLWT
jgi:hypothetical protein